MILNLSPYWTYPPTGGGPIRIYNLNKNLSNKGYFIAQISFRPPYIMKNKCGIKNIIYSKREITLSPNYIEYQVSNPFSLFSSIISYKLLSNPDVLMRKLIFGKLWYRDIFSLFNDTEIIQVEHPWLFNMARKYNRKGNPIFLSTHNCETILIGNKIGRKSIKFAKIEKDAIEDADVIFAVSEEDVCAFENILDVNIKNKKVYIVPNGVDTQSIKFITQEEREYAKKNLGFEDRNVILFTGSIHEPNIEAVWEIIKLAKNFDKSYLFLVVGSVGDFFKNVKTPPNIVFTGFIDDPLHYLRAADIALNPVLSGSGSNLKMLEYLALGLPTVSTPIGVRGLKIINGKHAIIANISEFRYWIEELLSNSTLSSRLSENGRKLMERCYDWRTISEIVNNAYKKHGR